MLSTRPVLPRIVPLFVDRFCPSHLAPKIEVPPEYSECRHIRVLRLAYAMKYIRREPFLSYHSKRGEYHVYAGQWSVFFFYHDLISPELVWHIMDSRGQIPREPDSPTQ